MGDLDIQFQILELIIRKDTRSLWSHVSDFLDSSSPSMIDYRLLLILQKGVRYMNTIKLFSNVPTDGEIIPSRSAPVDRQ